MMRVWRFMIVLGLVGGLVFTVAATERAWELIDWDRPISAGERLSAEEYILPEGWEKATEGVEEIFYFNSGGMRHDPATAENIRIFEELTGIKVNYAEVSSLILFDKTLSVMVARDPSVHASSLTDAPLELSQVIGANWTVELPFWTPEVQALYPSGLVEAMRGPSGHIYATVDTMRAYVLFYRPSWLEAAGVAKVPETWEEVREAARKTREWAVENLGPGYYGIVFPGDFNFSHMLQAGIYSQGGRVLVDGRPVFNTPEGRKAWQLFYDFVVTDGSAPEAVLGFSWADYQEVFARGKAAFSLGFTTYIVRYGDPEVSPGVQTDVFGNPVEGGDWSAVAPPKWDATQPDTNRAAFIDFDGFIINPFADDQHIAAAMLFAEFRMSRQAMTNEVVMEGNESFFPGVYADPRVMGLIPFAEVRKASIETTVMEAFPPGTKRAIDLLIEFFGRAVIGELEAQEALDLAQSEIDRIFRR